MTFSTKRWQSSFSHGRVQRWSRLHFPVQPLPYTCGNMVAPTPIIVVDHPTDSQKWVVLHRDGKFYESTNFSWS